MIFFRANHSSLLQTIAKEGTISEASDAQLKKIVADFLATFNA